MKTLVGGLLAGFAVGFALAYFYGENKLLEYELEAQQQYSSLLEQKQLTEKVWASTAREITEQSQNEVDDINRRYHALLDDNRLLKSAADTKCLSPVTAAPDGTQSSQSNGQSQPSRGVCEKSLDKAKRQILYYGKELDICSVHFNTLLDLYNSVL